MEMREVDREGKVTCHGNEGSCHGGKGDVAWEGKVTMPARERFIFANEEKVTLQTGKSDVDRKRNVTLAGREK